MDHPKYLGNNWGKTKIQTCYWHGRTTKIPKHKKPYKQRIKKSKSRMARATMYWNKPYFGTNRLEQAYGTINNFLKINKARNNNIEW